MTTKLNKEDTRLLLTTMGYTPINYTYQENNPLQISNKLAFLYPNITDLTLINIDLVKLIQKLNIESNQLSLLLLNITYRTQKLTNQYLKKSLFDELYSLLQKTNLDTLELEKRFMLDEEPNIEDELKGLSIEEAINFLKLYHVGHQRREDGYKILFQKYIKNKKELNFTDCIYIKDTFPGYYQDIDSSLFEKITKENPVLHKGKNTCFRKSGNCSKWGLPFIEIRYTYKQEENGFFSFNYLEKTSNDDYVQGFFKEDIYSSNIKKTILSVEAYLRERKEKGMLTAPNFEAYFTQNIGLSTDDFYFD